MEVKICGLTNLDDAKAALGAGADFLGFVLYQRSPRGISASALREIADNLTGKTRLVGVFVNEDPEAVALIASDCGLHAVQLHGDERPDEFAGLNMPVWRAVRIRTDRTASPPPAQWPAERYVVDALVPGLYGGTGMTIDWTAARKLAATFPLMLAGGLTPENVRQAIAEARPKGVDVAGGVEREPGRKDHRKIEAFIRRAKEA